LLNTKHQIISEKSPSPPNALRKLTSQ
jgi:hypothetical protein